MVTFDYRCDTCNAVVELFVRTPAPQTHEHPCHCGGLLQRQPAAPGFKVNGFNAANNYGLKEKK